MDKKQIEEAAALLATARRTAQLLGGLPPALQPQSVAEATPNAMKMPRENVFASAAGSMSK